ncbi:methyltransferase type 11 [Oleiphilus messinensis]|uniref:Methyltransferase type 11 n=1 Tax=Oleiphilus messinensis TaxID=141451 RepID=A0A1Y0IEH8_9GAMM|nr:class I SAM-dependent methyltransferase [Oleiphilus messinensis]ARU57783.1 methyltransferase type 11 [Oleiphilus messinensis]
MAFYENYILPHLINVACGTKPVRKQREKVVPHAEGRILEVGMGSGLNLPYYDPDKVEFIWGLEPSEGMRRKAAPRIEASKLTIEWMGLKGEEIPLDDNSVDTVLLTYTLCTIPDWLTALQQMRRVLKPGGKVLFCEHGEAPDESVRRWQEKINPYWNKVAGGCHLNRPIPRLLHDAGFKIKSLDTQYVPSTPKFAGFTYWGYAQQD